jgi:putative proteasome-type protease
MFEVARRVGDALREMHARDGEALRLQGEFNRLSSSADRSTARRRACSRSTRPATVEATLDTTYFQIGESKYGSPSWTASPRQHVAQRSGQVRADSRTRRLLHLRGLPLDLVIVRCDEYCVASHVDIAAENRYFQMIRNGWGEALREAFSALPNPDWLGLR